MCLCMSVCVHETIAIGERSISQTNSKGLLLMSRPWNGVFPLATFAQSHNRTIRDFIEH